MFHRAHEHPSQRAASRSPRRSAAPLTLPHSVHRAEGIGVREPGVPVLSAPGSRSWSARSARPGPLPRDAAQYARTSGGRGVRASTQPLGPRATTPPEASSRADLAALPIVPPANSKWPMARCAPFELSARRCCEAEGEPRVEHDPRATPCTKPALVRARSVYSRALHGGGIVAPLPGPAALTIRSRRSAGTQRRGYGAGAYCGTSEGLHMFSKHIFIRASGPGISASTFPAHGATRSGPLRGRPRGVSLDPRAPGASGPRVVVPWIRHPQVYCDHLTTRSTQRTLANTLDGESGYRDQVAPHPDPLAGRTRSRKLLHRRRDTRAVDPGGVDMPQDLAAGVETVTQLRMERPERGRDEARACRQAERVDCRRNSGRGERPGSSPAGLHGPSAASRVAAGHGG